MPKSVRVSLALTFIPALAEEPISPDQQKKAEAQGAALPPELKKDAKPPLEVTDAARPVLDKVRDEVKDDLLFGSTGEQGYVYSRNQYVTAAAPKSRVGVGDLPRHIGDLLKEKDPSLLLAATSEDTPYLAEGATKVDKGEDVKVDDATFTSLKVSTENGADVTVLVDPTTSLLRRWSVDLKKSL